MNIAIVDDSSIDLEILHHFATQYCEASHLSASIHTFQNPADFLQSLEEFTYDITFLDILFQDMNGISLAEEIRKKGLDCFIIFTTSSEEYAVDGFRVRAFDYIVKPVSYQRFKETCDLCTRLLPAETQYIEVKEGRSYTKVLVSDIYYTDYYNHYIQIHTPDMVVRSYMPFSSFEPLISRFPQFLCCYRNCTVNLDKVVSLENRTFILTNGDRVPIATKLFHDVQKAYQEYTFRKKLQ